MSWSERLAPRVAVGRGAIAAAPLRRSARGLRLPPARRRDVPVLVDLRQRAAPRRRLSAELDARARRGGNAKVVDGAADAEVVLDVPIVVDDKDVLSLSSGGARARVPARQARRFRLHDTDGLDWLPPGEIVVRRVLHVQRDPGARARRCRSSGSCARCRPTPSSSSCGGCRRRGSRPDAGADAACAAPTTSASHLARAARAALRRARRRAAAGARSRRRDPRRGARGRLRRARSVRGRAGLPLGRVPRGQREPGPVRRPQAASTCASRRASPASKARRRSKPTRRNPNPDNVTLVSLPRLDRAAQSSAWFSALAGGRRDDRRVSGRARRAAALDRGAARAPETAARGARRLAFLAEAAKATCSPRGRRSRSSRCCCPRASSTHDAVERAVADVARYDVFAALRGLARRRRARVRCASSRRCARKAKRLTLAVWQLAEDVHALAPMPADGARRHAARPRSATRASGASGRRRWSAPHARGRRRRSHAADGAARASTRCRRASAG